MVKGCGALRGIPLGEMRWYTLDGLKFFKEEKLSSRRPCGFLNQNQEPYVKFIPLIKLCDQCAVRLGAKW